MSENILQEADAIQEEARQVIETLHLYEAWEAIGAEVHQVGSLPMGLLMTHRDVDFHVYTTRLNIEESFQVLQALCLVPGVERMEFRNLTATEEACLEFHVWFRSPENGHLWQIDMIQILRGSKYDGYFEHVAHRIRAVLTPETRLAILELKRKTPDTEHIMGIEYYQAVIRDGVRTWDEFMAWRNTHPIEGICDWCP